MESYLYLLIDLGCISVPLALSFYAKRPFFKEWKYFFPACGAAALVFLIWDYYFTDWAVWGFNPTYLTGIYFFNLPLEEVLFFFFIPYACVFTYFALTYLMEQSPLARLHKAISVLLILVLTLVGITHLDQWYTSTTFLGLSLVLALTLYYRKDLSFIYFSYLVILPFFFLSNGILTGSFLEKPIVWYDNSKNLGIRMFTIPVEDTFYGFLLILLTILGYEFLKKRDAQKVK